jgi:hypothetical protein
MDIVLGALVAAAFVALCVGFGLAVQSVVSSALGRNECRQDQDGDNGQH